MNKGISPLISWVLIISFAVAIGMIIIPVFIDQISDWDPDPNIDYCDDVSLSLNSACVENGLLYLNISNNGLFSISEINLGRTTNVQSQQWCSFGGRRLNLPVGYEDFLPLEPNKNVVLKLNLEQNYPYNLDLDSPELCNITEISGGTSDQVVKIEIVPWIKPSPENDMVQCSFRKLILAADTNNLNTLCT